MTMHRSFPVHVALPFVACALALSACSGSGDTVVVTATEVVDPDSGEVYTTVAGQPEEPPTRKQDTRAKEADWRTEYAKVLDNPGSYNFDLPNPTGIALEYAPDGNYRYALVEANGGGTPELLLSFDGVDEMSNHFSRVLLFQVGDGGTAEASTSILTQGASGAGGYRVTIQASQLGYGLYQSEHSSGTGNGDSTWCEVDGTEILSAEKPRDFNIQYAFPLHLEITWAPIEDRGPLERGDLTVALPEARRGNAPADAPDAVAEGTVVMKHGYELRPEGMPNNEDPNSEYLLLQLDAPQDFTDYRASGEVVTRDTETISLGGREISTYPRDWGTEWEQVLGKRVRLTMAADSVHFQTDTGMPMGALRVVSFKNVEVLD